MGLRQWLTAGDLEVRSESKWYWPTNDVALSNVMERWPQRTLSATDLAMQVPTAVRCVEILATQAAQFLPKAYRDDVELDEQPRKLRRPNPFLRYYDHAYPTIQDMLFEGFGAWWVDAFEEDTGLPLAVSHLPACEIELRWDPALPVAEARRLKRREIKYGGAVLDPGRVILIPMIEVPGEARPVGPVQAGRPTNLGQVAADELVRSNFTAGSFPSGTVEVPTAMSEENAEKLKARFVEKTAGSRAPVVMSGGAEFKPHQITARDSQWIEARQWGAADIARLFGVPAAMLQIPVQGGSQITYSNAVSVRTELLHTGLGPINVRLENAYSKLLPFTQDAHLDTTDYLPPLEAIVPTAADPNRPPDPPAPAQPAQDPTQGNTRVV